MKIISKFIYIFKKKTDSVVKCMMPLLVSHEQWRKGFFLLKIVKQVEYMVLFSGIEPEQGSVSEKSPISVSFTRFDIFWKLFSENGQTESDYLGVSI